MGYLAIRRKFVAHTVRVDILELLTLLGRNYHVMGAQSVPEIRNPLTLWLALQVDILTVRHFCLECQTFRPAKTLLRLLIFQVRVHDLHHTRGHLTYLWPVEIEEHHGRLLGC